jgi:pimeloyl-ACP methyl ester carboxylesterase
LPGSRLPRRAFAFREQWVDDAHWHVRESLGELPPTAPHIVLVPGLGSGSYLLEHGAALAGQARVWIPDLPGFGRSRARRRINTVPGWADALARWHRAVLPGPAGYVGSSFGAQVVACLAARHPDLVRRAVLVGPTFDAAARRVVPQLARWLPTSAREPAGLGSKLLVSYLQSGVGTPLRGFRAGLRHPTERDVAEIRVPLLLVRGENDRIVPAAWVAELTERAPDGRAVLVPGVAHTVDYSAAEALAELTLPFFCADESIDSATVATSRG